MPSCLQQLGEASGPALLKTAADLRSYLATVPDPRARRGIRHPWTALLTSAAAAVLAPEKVVGVVGGGHGAGHVCGGDLSGDLREGPSRVEGACRQRSGAGGLVRCRGARSFGGAVTVAARGKGQERSGRCDSDDARSHPAIMKHR
ncbi:transposase family protein [Streptomyces adustus]|uniref:Transposase family protein n=1 Tax=Streptomyces adustus TaxID=1609272 RepID=A0A5N8VL28_9ACTN|nr:transposase family protein [Streptomyces adustus]